VKKKNKTEIDKNEENKEDEGEYEGNVKLDKDDFEGEEDFEKMDKDKEKNTKKRTFNQRELEGFYESSGFIPFKGAISNINKRRKYNN